MEIAGVAKNVAVSVMRIGFGVYIGLCILLFLRQSHMVYYPASQIILTPSSIGLEYEDVCFTASDGERITAWFVPAENARGTMLMCHGNGGNIGDRMHSIELFHNLGLNVFIFDYRGYGNSSGRPSEGGMYQDALGAWNYLTRVKHVPAESIVVFGRSLGSAVATWLAEQETAAGLIMEASFISIPDIGAGMYPYLPVRLLCRYSYNTLSCISKIKCPVLIAHSRDDDMIPFAHSQKLFEAASEPKTFFELSGSHNYGEAYTPELYRKKLDEFLTDCLSFSGHEERRPAFS